MSKRFVHTVSLNEEEEKKVKSIGKGVMFVFRRGLESLYINPERIYGCGCKYTGSEICKEHGRI